MSRKPKIALIDSHALIHRAYHALPPMSSRQGIPTNAAYGFTTMLLKMLTTIKPTHVAAAFDEKGPTFRHKQFKDYKAHRAVAADDLVAQFEVVRQILKAFNIPVVSKSGYEADDIIGTLTEQIDHDAKKIIISGDLDTLQLVDEDTSVFTLKRGISDTILYNPNLVMERYGFAPKYVPDYKGLAGDASDNIPGVAGIGDKTAKELVQKYGSIEKIYEHLAELPTRAKTRLTGHKKDALFSRKLATIKRNVPVSFKLKSAELSDYSADQVKQIFEELDFRSLISRIPKSRHGGVQPTLLKVGTSRQQAIDMPLNYHLISDEKQANELRKTLLSLDLIAFDTETERLGARTEAVVGMSFAARIDGNIEAWYVPITVSKLNNWREVLETSTVGKVGHNLKYDLEVLKQSGLKLSSIKFDSMIASYLLHPDARQHSLDTIAVQELGHHAIPITTLIGEGKNQKKMSEVPLEKIARYACEDADLSLQLYEVFSAKIKEQNLTRVLEEIELPLIPVLADIELTGVAIDKIVLMKLREKVKKRLAVVKAAILKDAGKQFNINSTQQLRQILYEKLNLPTVGITRTQSGWSTAARELSKLRGQHPIIERLEEYRELAKLLNTYIDTLPNLIDKKTGRIHASFNQTVAATGRLSSSDPNLQNIPARTELGQEIRSAFISGRGRVLIKADYSQLELRIAAHLSHDEKMIDAFRAEEDIHRSTAAWVHSINVDQVTDKQRQEAKTLNFGVLYGMGAQNFARAAELSVEEAASFIERYREQYVGIMALIEQTINQAESLGYVETMFGRRRFLPEINSNNSGIRAGAERAAFNFPIQGTAADILKKAMITLHKKLQTFNNDSFLILTVHDELVVDAPKKQAQQIANELKKIMEAVVTLDVPLLADISIGPNWRDVKPVTVG